MVGGPPDVGEGPRFSKLRGTRREASNESCRTHIFSGVQVFPQPHKKQQSRENDQGRSQRLKGNGVEETCKAGKCAEQQRQAREAERQPGPPGKSEVDGGQCDRHGKLQDKHAGQGGIEPLQPGANQRRGKQQGERA